MKSNSTSTIVFLLVSLSSFGQDLWPNENAEWWFELGPWLYNPSIEHRYVDGDTLINNVSCTRITSDRYWSYNPNSTDLNLHSSDEEFVYYNGDTLFWWKVDDFYPLICFNAEVGEGWYPLPYDESSNCDYNPVTVESIETVFYNDQPFRKVTISPFNEFTSTFFWGGSFDERTFWREYGYPESNQCGLAVEWLTFSFRCYDDGLLTISESSGECEPPLSVSSPKYAETVIVYPNPIKNGESITVKDAEIRSFFSLSGKRLDIESGINQFEIPNGTPPGIYIIELSLINGDVTYSKLLVN